MKKKGPRSIPDFSRKPQGRPAAVPDGGSSAPPKSKPMVVKPPAVTSKSGRRGQ